MSPQIQILDLFNVDYCSLFIILKSHANVINLLISPPLPPIDIFTLHLPHHWIQAWTSSDTQSGQLGLQIDSKLCSANTSIHGLKSRYRYRYRNRSLNFNINIVNIGHEYRQCQRYRLPYRAILQDQYYIGYVKIRYDITDIYWNWPIFETMPLASYH